GIILGDPDTTAVARYQRHPVVHTVSEMYRAGVVADNRAFVPVNSQNTAFLAEFAPCFLMCPQFGRYDDIFAGLIAQRCMRERGYHLHLGRPFVWQERNAHDPQADLAAENWGNAHVARFADWLDQFVFAPDLSVLRMVSLLY